jgi:hypothetical protein
MSILSFIYYEIYDEIDIFGLQNMTMGDSIKLPACPQLRFQSSILEVSFYSESFLIMMGAHPSVYAGVVIKYMPPVMPRYIGGAV